MPTKSHSKGVWSDDVWFDNTTESGWFTLWLFLNIPIYSFFLALGDTLRYLLRHNYDNVVGLDDDEPFTLDSMFIFWHLSFSK